MFGIYKTINLAFEGMLGVHGYKFIMSIKSNIHPSLLYCNQKLKLQIGYDYEEDKPYANLYGTRLSPPAYSKHDNLLSVEAELMEYSHLVDKWLQDNGASRLRG